MKYIVGAYATAPSLAVDDKSVEHDFYENLIDSMPEIRGLEIPFWGKEIHRFGSDFLLDIIQPHWENVLTCIPGTMNSLSKNSKFGLASDDDLGRLDAIEMHKRANQSLHKINEYYGRKSVIAVHIATAPSMPVEGVLSSTGSLLKSMEEILSWDWQGAKIVIEHCDTAVNGRNYEKGFLPLKDEIKTLLKIRKIFDVGITINWARSAIEGRSVDTPLEHLRLLSINKLLSGLMFSGVSKNDRKYGSWKDNHMPFSQPSICVNNDFFEKNSLLTQKNITSTLGEIDVNNLDYLGIKILAMPIDKSSIKTRVGYNKTAISTIEESLKSLNRGYTHK